MGKQISPQKWIVSFFAIVLAILITLSGLAYIVDPFFQFRIKDNSYLLNEWFVGSGLIKNYDYDTLILGSSMTQNFDMDLIREKLDSQPLHVGLGGVNSLELGELINLAYEANKAERYFVCVDMYAFTNDAETSRNPSYLLRNDVLSRFHYLLSYEPWFRYIPVDLSLITLDWMGVSLPPKFEYRRNIDKLGDWRMNFTFGEEVVLKNYKSAKFSVSVVDTDNLYNRMIEHIDRYLSEFNFKNGQHIFFFPPYSSLYWCDAQDSGYFDSYLQAKRYFVKKATGYGATMYDFQCADFTTDLNNYKDTTHYTPEINNWMVDCFANLEYVITEQNSGEFQTKLTENTNSFRKAHAELFEE